METPGGGVGGGTAKAITQQPRAESPLTAAATAAAQTRRRWAGGVVGAVLTTRSARENASPFVSKTKEVFTGTTPTRGASLLGAWLGRRASCRRDPEPVGGGGAGLGWAGLGGQEAGGALTGGGRSPAAERAAPGVCPDSNGDPGQVHLRGAAQGVHFGELPVHTRPVAEFMRRWDLFPHGRDLFQNQTQTTPLSLNPGIYHAA